MSVHYKFKSSKDFDTVTFDGAVISVADLKREIIRQQKLGKANDFDLEITNAQTNEGKLNLSVPLRGFERSLCPSMNNQHHLW